MNYLPRLTGNLHPPDLCLLSRITDKNYQHPLWPLSFLKGPFHFFLWGEFLQKEPGKVSPGGRHVPAATETQKKKASG
jgi:hypothetical protein